MRRSGKVEFLFWLSFAAIFIFLWIAMIAVELLFEKNGSSLAVSQEPIRLLFILYGILTLCTVVGTVVSIFIGNKRYANLFGALFVIMFFSVIAGKSVLG